MYNSRYLFPWTMTNISLPIMRFWQLYTANYPSKQSNNIWPTYCKSRGGGQPLQLAPIRSRIHLEYNKHVGCYLCHSEMMLTIKFSGLLTSFRYHLPLLFHTSTSWIHNLHSQVRADLNQADWPALRQIRHWLAHTENADTSYSTVTLPMQPPEIWPLMHI